MTGELARQSGTALTVRPITLLDPMDVFHRIKLRCNAVIRFKQTISLCVDCPVDISRCSRSQMKVSGDCYLKETNQRWVYRPSQLAWRHDRDRLAELARRASREW